MNPPVYKSFFHDLTNLILLGVLIIGMFAFCIFYFYQVEYLTGDYTRLHDFKELNVGELDKEDLDKENYVRLHGFCIDDQSVFWEISESRSSKKVYNYYFLNNMCDSAEGPMVIMEMDEDTYEQFSAIVDENEMQEKIFTGRMYKGFKHCEIPFWELKKYAEIDTKSMYTFKAGQTPAKVRKKAMVSVYVWGSMTMFGIISFIVALISHNIRRKKEYLRKLEKYNSEKMGQL